MNTAQSGPGKARAVFCLVAALALGTVAWMLPARWRSLHPAVVSAAGRDTPGIADLTSEATEARKPGVAQLLWQAAIQSGASRTNQLAAAITDLRAKHPELLQLGGRDETLLRLLPAKPARDTNIVLPALDSFLPEQNRTAIRQHLETSRSPSVAVLLRTREMPTRQFVGATKPGGQPLDAVILLTTVLYEGEHLAPSLAQELRTLAESASESSASEPLEEFYLGMLVLSRRLDWTALADLTRLTATSQGLVDFATAAKSNSGDLPLLYAAALMSGDAGGVARRFLDDEEAGRATLRSAVGYGTGSVRLVLRSKKTIQPGGEAPKALAGLALAAPRLLLAVKFILFLDAGWLAAWGITSLVRSRPLRGGDPHHLGPLPRGFEAVIIGLFCIAASEPVPPSQAKPPEYQLRLRSADLTNTANLPHIAQQERTFMDATTILTIAFFAALQIAVYLACLRKIREIDELPENSLMKLRLMENEENLFDAGLYVGIGGTAAALVLQVLHVLEANLLAAYSSNLMGIIAVALVKIRHVRPYKRQLILEGQVETTR
jgi:hypothetical protein